MKNLAFLLFTLNTIVSCQWIKEYQAFQEKEFVGLDGWYIQQQFEATTNIITKCGDINIVGGFKTFGTRATMTKMIKIPPHYKLKFNLQFWKIGEWENDQIIVYVDGVPWIMKWGFTEGGQQLCGGPASKNSDKVYDVEFEILHNSPTPTIVITSSLKNKGDIQSWGLRQMAISYLPCPSDCGICHNDKVDECKSWNQVGLSWFQTDVALEGWNLENGKAKSSECSGVVLFGGYENMGSKSVLSRKFGDLPAHSKVLIKFAFWKIDFWDNDAFFVNIDGKQVFKQAFQKSDGVDLCGAEETLPGYGEKIVGMEFILKHTAKDLTISFSSTLTKDWDDSSWGIRDFFIFVAECTKFCNQCVGPAVNECTQCDEAHNLKDGKCYNKLDWYILSKEFNDNSDFEELHGWELKETFPEAPKPPINSCGNIKIVGGSNVLGKNAIATKQYTKLPLHDHIRIKLKLYKIDFWDGEQISISADQKQLWKTNLGWNDPAHGNVCGDLTTNWGERILDIDQIIPHTSEDLLLEITSKLLKPADKCSWGFRQVMILYSPLKQCIEVYSECQYKGKMAKLCDNTDSFKDQQIDFDVKSVKIPDGMKITGFSNASFKGDRIEFETSQACLEKIEFAFLQKSPLSANNSLRRI